MSFSLNVEKKFFNETLRLIKIFFLTKNLSLSKLIGKIIRII